MKKDTSNPFKTSCQELSGLLKNRFLRLAVLVVGIIPVLYGALYLWAFWNPYGRLSSIPVAVINEDTGTLSNDKIVNFGQNLVDSLKNNQVLKWDFVSGLDAANGLSSHKYFAEIIIPSDFSLKITSASTNSPEQAKVIFKARESNSMIGSQLSNRVASQISENLSHEITKQYLDNIFGKMRSSAENVNTAANGSQKLSSGLENAKDGSQTLSSGSANAYEGSIRLVAGVNNLLLGSRDINVGINQSLSGAKSLNDGITSAANGSSTLAAGSASLQSGANLVNSGVNQLISNMSEAESSLTTAKGYLSDPDTIITDAGNPFNGKTKLQAANIIIASILQTAQSTENQQQIADLKEGLTDLVSGSASVKDGASSLSTALNNQIRPGSNQLAAGLTALSGGSNQLQAGVDTALSGSKSLSSGLSQVKNGSKDLTGGISSAQTGAEELGQQLSVGAKQALSGSDISLTNKLSPVMSNPVALDDQSINKVPNYGTGFAPYFIPLALWVGSLVLFLLIKIDKNKDINIKPRVYLLSKFLTLAQIGTFQAIILATILILALGLRPGNYFVFFGFCILISWCFLAILEFLVAALQDGGKFIGIVLLMLQLTSAGGTYPVQTSPKFFRSISPYLPMTYAVKGLREIISGGNIQNIWLAFAVITIFLLGFLMLTAISSKRILNSKINFSV